MLFAYRSSSISHLAPSFDSFSTCKLWNCQTGECIETYNHRGPVHGVAWSEDNRKFATISDPFVEHNRQDAGREVDEDRLYFLELLDKQRHDEDITDEELDDIDQLLEDEEQIKGEKSGEDDCSVRSGESGE